MASFGAGAIGVDLGSEHTTVYVSSENIMYSAPSRVLVSSGNQQDVLAVGHEAKALSGRTSIDVELISPIISGAVADIDMAALLLVALIEKATGRKRALDKNSLAVNIPTGLTYVERSALIQVMNATGCRRMATIKAPVAAAIGAGLDIKKPKGVMVAVIGGGTIEIAVMSMGAVIAARFVRGGSSAMDDAIARWFWREKGIVIGQKTAEQLKVEIGTALDSAESERDDEPVLLKGREARSGKPMTIETNRRDILAALDQPVKYIVDLMRNALYNAPPELAADILEQGLFLSGGGALLHGLAGRLKRDTGLKTHLSEHTDQDIALGIGTALTDDKLYQVLVEAGSADDIGA
jgi:rod shape-determining protein MreB